MRVAAAALVLAVGTAPLAAEEEAATATFAGGCFWCTEADFEKVRGVLSAVSGYIGGSEDDASYETVSAGRTDHLEAVEIRFDPARVSYPDLLQVFWRSIDPLDGDGQFCDRGAQYRPAVFFHGEAQQRQAEMSLTELERSGRFDQPTAVELRQATPFYPAEDYHQDYYRKNPVRYLIYRWNCGRDQRLAELWGPTS